MQGISDLETDLNDLVVLSIGGCHCAGKNKCHLTAIVHTVDHRGMEHRALTHWPLEDVVVILNVKFEIYFSE